MHVNKQTYKLLLLLEWPFTWNIQSAVYCQPYGLISKLEPKGLWHVCLTLHLQRPDQTSRPADYHLCLYIFAEHLQKLWHQFRRIWIPWNRIPELRRCRSVETDGGRRDPKLQGHRFTDQSGCELAVRQSLCFKHKILKLISSRWGWRMMKALRIEVRCLITCLNFQRLLFFSDKCNTSTPPFHQKPLSTPSKKIS